MADDMTMREMLAEAADLARLKRNALEDLTERLRQYHWFVPSERQVVRLVEARAQEAIAHAKLAEWEKAHVSTG